MIKSQPTPNELERIKTLHEYAVLDTLPEQELDDITALAAAICGAPIAMVSLLDEHRQWFKSKIGIETSETARDISFCGHVVQQRDLFIVPDAFADERYAENPLVTGEPGIRFYAGAPLINPEGAALGALCVIDHVKRTLTSEQKQSLRVLSRQVMTHLELRRQTHKLTESEERLRLVADNALVGLVIVDRDHRYTYANNAYAETLGLSTSTIVGKRIPDLLPGIYENQIRPRLDRAFAGERVTYELHKPSPKGDRHYLVRYEPTKTNDVVSLVVVVVSDITERKHAELAPLRLAAIVESSDDAIIGKDLNSIITSWNRGAEKIFRYSPIEIVGTSIMRLIPEDRQDEEAQILEKIGRGESVEHFETLRKTKDGRLIDISVTASPIKDATGKPIGVSKVARDITARKETEKALRDLSATQSSILNALPAHIALIDQEGVIVSVNEAWRQFAVNNAMKGIDFGVGHNYIEICEQAVGVWSDKAQSVALGIRRVLQHELAVFTIEYPCHSPTMQRWFLLQVVAVGESGSAGAVVMHVDISERKLTESALQKERDFISAVVDTVGSLVVVLDREARIVRFNRACEQLTGYSFDEALGQNLIDLVIMPEERASTKAEFENLCAGQFPNTYENHWLTKHGEPRVIAWSNTALVDADGRVEYVIGTGSDITERKRTEEARRVSELRYRTLFEYAPDGIVIADSESTYLDTNASMCRMLGYTRDELIGLNARDIVVQAEIPQIELALNKIKTKSDHQREWQFRRKDGSVFAAEVIATLMPDGNLLGMIRDITERKQAEKQIAEQAAFLDKARDAIVAIDLEGKILFWNKGAEHIYGWTREEGVGREMSELLGGDLKKLEEVKEVMLRQGEWRGERQHLTKDRRELTVEARTTLIRDKEGQPEAMLVIITDITEKKKIEAQFMRAQRMESIGTLAGGIAHDLNNILAPIMMSIDILKSTSDTPQTKKILETIEISAKRGADIVRQVLSFARGLEGQRIEVQPKHLLNDLESIIKDTFPKDIRLRFFVPNDTWTILGDPTQVHQILLNLCVNARDAMLTGGNLIIGVENCVLDDQYAAMNIHAKPGRYVIISVTDSGMGMPPDVIDKIFEPFFTTKELTKGTGLGLSTVMAIVKSHEGLVNVYSEPGKGTTFKVYLPAMEISSEARKEQSEAASLPRGNGEIILVVDDETSILTITGQTLQAFGYRILTASDGAHALGVYAEHKNEIAVVLTDMMMPVMDGPAMIHALMRMNPAVKIVAASGLNANGNVAKVSGAGVKHFLTKPYTAGILLKTIRTILDET